MTNYTVLPSKTFEREFLKLSNVDREKVWEKARLLGINPFHPSLRSKKLKGCHGHFECSVSMDIRIIWRYESPKIIIMLDVGHHDILKRY